MLPEPEGVFEGGGYGKTGGGGGGGHPRESDTGHPSGVGGVGTSTTLCAYTRTNAKSRTEVGQRSSRAAADATPKKTTQVTTK